MLDQVDIDAVGLHAGSKVGTKKWNQTGPHRQVVAQAVEKLGEPSGTRTLDPLIKSEAADPRTAMHDELSTPDHEFVPGF